MEWPRVTVQIATYRRPVEIRRVMDALDTQLIYSNLHYLVCDDCTGDDYLQNIEDDYKERVNIACTSTAENSGWGANVNNGLLQIADEFILFCEDDFLLHKQLDLHPIVALFLAKPHVGFMRLDGILGHAITAHVAEADIREYLPDYRQSWHCVEGKVGYWLIEPECSELWLYSNRPHFKRKSFHDFYGLYPVGLRLGATEEGYAHMVRDKINEEDAPQIVCLPDWVKGHFENIGKSYQHTDVDRW